jgi:hypothetical protein
MSGIHGLHILAPGLENIVLRLVKEAGLKDFRSNPPRDAGSFSRNGKNKSLPNLTINLNDSSGTEFHRGLSV